MASQVACTQGCLHIRRPHRAGSRTMRRGSLPASGRARSAWRGQRPGSGRSSRHRPTRCAGGGMGGWAAGCCDSAQLRSAPAQALRTPCRTGARGEAEMAHRGRAAAAARLCAAPLLADALRTHRGGCRGGRAGPGGSRKHCLVLARGRSGGQADGPAAAADGPAAAAAARTTARGGSARWPRPAAAAAAATGAGRGAIGGAAGCCSCSGRSGSSALPLTPNSAQYQLHAHVFYTALVL